MGAQITASPETDLGTRPQEASAVWSEEQARKKRGGALGEPTDKGSQTRYRHHLRGSLLFPRSHRTPNRKMLVPAAPGRPSCPTDVLALHQQVSQLSHDSLGSLEPGPFHRAR